MSIGDRQKQKSIEAIKTAFADLVFNKRYEEITIGEIANNANVGRSTFYMHFKNKDDVLIAGMDWLLITLARTAIANVDLKEVEQALEHLWQYREKARRIFSGTPFRRISTALANEVVAALSKSEQGQNIADQQLAFTSRQISASTLSVINTWIFAEASASPNDLAVFLVQSNSALFEIGKNGAVPPAPSNSL